jgi:hypothetical protein
VEQAMYVVQPRSVAVLVLPLEGAAETVAPVR